MTVNTAECELFLSRLSSLASEDRAKREQQAAEEPPDFNALSFFKSREEIVSKIIAFLLTPTAGHGQGQLLLRAFLSVLRVPFQTMRSVVVEPESPCYELPTKKRMDVLIRFADESGETVVVLESKSHFAVDQDNQIKDYLAHINKAYPCARKHLFYLKNSEPPPEESIPLRDWKVAQASGICEARDFSVVILDWLKECRRLRMPQKILTFLQDFAQFSGSDKEGAVSIANGVRDAVLSIIQTVGSDGETVSSDLEALLAIYDLHSDIWEGAARVHLDNVQTLLKEQLPNWETQYEVYQMLARPYFELTLWKVGWTRATNGTANLRVIVASEDQNSREPTYIDIYIAKNESFTPERGVFNDRHVLVIGPGKNDITRQVRLGGIEDLRSAAGVRYLLTPQGTMDLGSEIVRFVSDHEMKMDVCFREKIGTKRSV
jgi:hypothetical protein